MSGAIIPAPIDYTNWDFASARARIIALLSSAFPMFDWESDAELATALGESEAWVLDHFAYYLRALGRESRIATVTTRQNMVSLLKLIAYRPRGAVAAQWTQTFTLAQAMPADVILRAGRIVKTTDVGTAVKFQLLADVTIPAGQLTGSGTVEHSTTQTDVFTSDGTTSQTYRLSMLPYLDGSAAPVAGDGAYTEVANFLASGAADRNFTTSTDQFDRCTIGFGNGISGAIPNGTITVPYKTGGGPAGNVAVGAVTIIEGVVRDEAGHIVRATTTNTAQLTIGAARESLEQLRVNGPASLATGNVSVNPSDFEANALRGVAGIGRILALDSARYAAIQPNTMAMYVVGADGLAPAQELLDDIHALFIQDTGRPRPAYPAIQTMRVNVYASQFATANLQCTVFRRQGVTRAVARANILASLTSMFRLMLPNGAANPQVDFGWRVQDEDGNPTGFFAWSDFFNAIRDAQGILRIPPGGDGLLINGERQDLAIGPAQFPKLGSVILLDGSDGLTL